MKDIGSLPYCLGVSVFESKDCIWLHQKQYFLTLLQNYGLMDAKVISTPTDQNVKLVKDDGVRKELEDRTLYQSMVGSLLYAAMTTHPHSTSSGTLSKFCAQSTEAYLTAVKTVLHYLSSARDLAPKYIWDE